MRADGLGLPRGSRYNEYRHGVCLLCMMISFCLSGCSFLGIGKGNSGSEAPYRMDTDMLYINGHSLTIVQVRIIADFLWEAFEKQYSSDLKDSTLLESACFYDSEITLREYEKEYALYREMLMLFCFSQMYDIEQAALEIPEQEVLQAAGAYYETHYKNVEKVTLEDCNQVFIMYYKARQYQQLLRQSINLIVSDEQVRVVSCGIVKTENYDVAAQLLKDLETGGDFFMLAEADGVNLLENTAENVSREDDRYPKEVIEQLFRMETGEVSGIIAAEAAYYVVTVTNMFHETLSAQNRERLVAELTNDYYERVCNDYIQEADVYFNQQAWETLSFPVE